MMKEKEGILANEKYLSNVLSMLREGGSYVFPHFNAVFIKRGGKFTGTRENIQKVGSIVSPVFLKLHFEENK